MTTLTSPGLCVITPSFRQGRFIKRTIESVLSQGVECDYVVVDGGSDDETVDILKSYGERVRWVSEPDRGQSHAINKGLRMTDAEIICWINSDDLYYPGTLPRIQQFFAERPDIDLVYGKAHYIDADDHWIEDYGTEAWNFDRLQVTCHLCQPATFFRRRLIDRVGPINETLNYCMDYELWIRVAQAGLPVAYLDDGVLAGSRMHEAAKTVSSTAPAQKEILGMLKRRLGSVPDVWFSNYAHATLPPKVVEGGDNLRRRIELSVRAVLASLRWNGSVRWSLLRLVHGWMIGMLMQTPPVQLARRAVAKLRREIAKLRR